MERRVGKVVKKLKVALGADYVVLGGGNSKKLKKVPAGARLGSNENAFLGGFRMWEKNQPDNPLNRSGRVCKGMSRQKSPTIRGRNPRPCRASGRMEHPRNLNASERLGHPPEHQNGE